MTDRELAESFVQQIGEFVTRGETVEVGRVATLSLAEIEAVMVRVIEEVALNAPGLVVHLAPRRTRLEQHLPAVELQRPIAGLQWCASSAAAGSLVGCHGRPLLTLAVEDFRAVAREGKVVDLIEELVGLTLLQVELVEHLRQVRLHVLRNDRRRLGDIEHAGLAGDEADVVSCRDRQRQDPLRDAIAINLYRRRLGRAGAGRCGRRSRGRPLLVALRRERGGLVAAQHRDIDAARYAMLITRHIEALNSQGNVSGRCEIQVASVGIECGIAHIAHTITQLHGRRGLERVGEQRRLTTGELACVGNVATVRRPDCIEGSNAEELEHPAIDQPGLRVVESHVPELQLLVRVEQLRAIWGPPRRVIERWLGTEANAAHGAKAILAADAKFVLARFIREVRDRLAVW